VSDFLFRVGRQTSRTSEQGDTRPLTRCCGSAKRLTLPIAAQTITVVTTPKPGNCNKRLTCSFWLAISPAWSCCATPLAGVSFEFLIFCLDNGENMFYYPIKENYHEKSYCA
jgi:hypothetical protein